MANTCTVMEAGLTLKTHGLGCFLHPLHGQYSHSKFLVCGCQLLGLPINLSVFAQSPPLRLLQSTYVAFLPSSSWLIKVDMGVFRRFENSKNIVTPWSWTSPGNLLGRERQLLCLTHFRISPLWPHALSRLAGRGQSLKKNTPCHFNSHTSMHADCANTCTVM